MANKFGRGSDMEGPDLPWETMFAANRKATGTTAEEAVATTHEPSPGQQALESAIRVMEATHKSKKGY